MRGEELTDRLIVAGICCEADTIFPARAFRTELNIQFAGMYTPVEFANTLRLIAEGELSVSPIATGAVSIVRASSASVTARLHAPPAVTRVRKRFSFFIISPSESFAPTGLSPLAVACYGAQA